MSKSGPADFEVGMFQATMEDEESGPAKQIGKLIGVDPDLLIDNFVQPKIKVKILMMVVINDQSKGTMRCHEETHL